MNTFRKLFSPQELGAGLGILKRNKWVTGLAELSPTPAGKKGIDHYPLWSVLQSIGRGEDPSANPNVVAELMGRGLLVSKTTSNESVTLTAAGLTIFKNGERTPILDRGKKLGSLTPEIIQSGAWKNMEFKPYDVSAGVEKRHGGRIHPLRHVMRDVRQIMVELGFREMDGPLVESAFWNMDAMFIPQDHPAREVQDTFYLDGRAILEDAELVKRIKATHEHGGKTGSKGFGYEWNPSIAMQLLLRTHTTATTFRELGKGITFPMKRFSIGRIFRNEAMDATHLSEFHQVEGFIAGEGLTLRHLMGIITAFYSALGLTKIRFKPTYNPYTEPSMEASAYHPGLKKWVELINSGMFRPEALKPYGITVPVIAWGFGLERLALFMHEKNALREIIGPDVNLDFIREYAGTSHGVFSKRGEGH